MQGPVSDVLRVGSRFGVYDVKECIGQGAMGQVYRAEHSLLRKTVALKVMARAARQSPAGQHRFLREARAAAAIKHPHVVDILDVGVLDGMPFIVMEFLEGVDLETYLKRHGVLNDQALADLALPIIAAIGAVHDAGVIHRDIKPSNIFLAKGSEEDLLPKVLDFGISKALKGLVDAEFEITGPGDLVGTPLYISPEALAGSQHLTPRSDQYSLGVVLYECATGRLPFYSKDLAGLVRAVVAGVCEPMRSIRPEISQELEAVVSRAMSRHPEQRFEHVRELGAALWGLASERTRHVWSRRFSTSSGVRTSRWRLASVAVRRHLRRSTGLLLGAALSLLAVGGWWLWREPSPPVAGPGAAAVAASLGSPQAKPAGSSSAVQTVEAGHLAASTPPAAEPVRRVEPANAPAQTVVRSLISVRPAIEPPAAGRSLAPVPVGAQREMGKSSRGGARRSTKTQRVASPGTVSSARAADVGADDSIRDLFAPPPRAPSVQVDGELDGLLPRPPRAPAAATSKDLQGANQSPLLD